MGDCDKASKSAADCSSRACSASAKAYGSSKAKDHEAAGRAHTEAAQAHLGAQEQHETAGNSDQAAHHADMARMHDSNTKLHDTRASISMSAAKDDKKMPFPPKKDDAKKPADAPPEDAAPPADGDAGEDMGGDGPITDPIADALPPADDGAKGAEEAEAMATLESELSELGIEFHGSASDSLLTFLQHLNTAILTHKATKNGPQDEPNAAEQDDPNNPDTNPNPTQEPEPEVAQGAPIMMSTAPTPREEKMIAKLLKNAKPSLLARIKDAHRRGYIDDAIKKELEAELGTVKLSQADLTDDFDLKPLALSLKLDMIERIAKSGKPGSFAKPKAQTGATGKPDPLKPISSAVQLSTAEEEVVPQPYEPDDKPAARPLDVEMVSLIAPGFKRYAAEQTKNGQPI